MKVPTLLGLFAVLVLSGCASLFGPAATRTPPLQIEQPQEPQEARPGNRVRTQHFPWYYRNSSW